MAFFRWTSDFVQLRKNVVYCDRKCQRVANMCSIRTKRREVGAHNSPRTSDQPKVRAVLWGNRGLVAGAATEQQGFTHHNYRYII